MTLSVVAEAFVNVIDPDAPVPGSSWVGASPRLEVADEGRFGRLDDFAPISGATFIGYEVAGELDTSITVSARHRLTAPSGSRSVALALYGFDASGEYAAFAVVTFATLPGDGVWREASGLLNISSTTATNFADCSRIFVGAEPVANASDEYLVYDLDWLHFSGPDVPPVEVLYPHRLIDRGDGLGMGSGRVFGATTRQSSGRVIGTF